MPGAPAVAAKVYVTLGFAEVRARGRRANYAGYVTLPELENALANVLATCAFYDLWAQNRHHD